MSVYELEYIMAYILIKYTSTSSNASFRLCEWVTECSSTQWYNGEYQIPSRQNILKTESNNGWNWHNKRWRKQNDKSRMDNPETLTTLVHEKQEEDKQNKKINTEN
jgi:hypothetical protein